MQVQVQVEGVCIDDVLQYDKIRYNTNNVYETQPQDYEEVRETCRTSHWIDAFKSYQVIRIDLTDSRASWLLEAVNMGKHTKIFPHAYDDELDALEALMNEMYASVFNGTEYFVRTEDVSLKAGQHGVGPYTDVKSILESLVTCVEGHTPIQPNSKVIVLYLIPWVKLNPQREYRVFVNEGRVTAVSQQHLYNVYPPMDHIPDLHAIVDYHDDVLKNSITHINSYCVDIAILDCNTPYFIEINPFGTEYTSGSSLFGWEQDRDILYGTRNDNTVFFRHTTPSCLSNLVDTDEKDNACI